MCTGLRRRHAWVASVKGRALDELTTRVFRQRADIDALQTAINALIVALPPAQQRQVLQAHLALIESSFAVLPETVSAATPRQALIDAAWAQHAQMLHAVKAVVSTETDQDEGGPDET